MPGSNPLKYLGLEVKRRVAVSKMMCYVLLAKKRTSFPSDSLRWLPSRVLSLGHTPGIREGNMTVILYEINI